MSETKAAFRLRVARRLGLVTEVTTTSVGLANGKSAVSLELADHFTSQASMEGKFVKDNTQTEWRRGIAYTPASGTISFGRGFTAQVADTTAIEVYDTFSPTDYDEALRAAIEEAYPYLAQLIVDTSVTLAANTYEYTIPSTILDLERMLGGKVERQHNTSVATYPYDEVLNWTTRHTQLTASQTYQLVVPVEEHITDRVLRITGLGLLVYPAADTDSLPLDSTGLNLLAYLTTAKLYSRAQNVGSEDRGFAEAQEQKYIGLWERFKDVWGDILDPTSMPRSDTGGVGDLPLARFAEPS